MEIDDFLPLYPTIDEEGFQRDIFRRKEFYENKMEEKPKELIDVDLFEHQINMARFVSPHTVNNELLLIHEMGTGKTYSSIAIAEGFKNSMEKALVLVKGDIVIRNFKEQLSKKFDEYRPDLERIEGAKAGELYERERNKLIREHYEVSTWGKFFGENTKRKKGETIGNYKNRIERVMLGWEKNYSNRVIIVDEVHNIREQSRKLKAIKGDEYILSKDQGYSHYEILHRFLHSVKGCKIILMSGTPMWNSESEIASVMNLILSSEEQLPPENEFRKKYFRGDELRDELKDELRHIFKGRVSYLRQAVNVERVDEGVNDYTKHIKLVLSEISDFQHKSMIMAKGMGTTGEKEVARKKEIDASTFVYPGGLIYDQGWGKIKKEKIRSKTIYKLSDELSDIRTISDLSKHSAKLATIFKHIRDNPTQCVFIFTESVIHAGVILIGLLLESVLGFRKGTLYSKEDPNIKRYISLTGLTEHNEKYIERFNKPENNHGSIYQVIIGSRAVSEAVTFKHIRQVHIPQPFWNLSTIDQGIGRAIRIGSHDELDNDEKNAHIFLHASTYKNEQTVDIDIYRITEKKDYKIQQILRIIKEASVDCPLNYARNVGEYDRDYSRGCNYQKCNYVCMDMSPIGRESELYRYDVPSEEIDKINYNIYYSYRDIKRIEKKILKIFLEFFYIDTESLWEKLDEEDSNLVIFALEKMINERKVIKDKFGFGNYLKESNNIFYLDKNIFPSDFSQAIYSATPMITIKKPLEKILNEIDMIEDIEKIKKDCNPLNLSIPAQALYLETAIDEGKIPEEYRKNILELKGRKTHDLFGKKLRWFTGKIWEDVPSELKIVKKRAEHMEIPEEKNFIGHIEDGKFKIARRITTKRGKQEIRSKACTSFRKNELIEFIVQLDLNVNTKNMKIKELCQVIRENEKL